MVTRAQRRRLAKQGVDLPDKFQVKYDIKVPGGLLRSEHPAQISGRIDADNEADLTRGIFVKLLESFGFLMQERTVVGLLASLINPFPKRMRGAIAYAIVQGHGLMVDTDQVQVCSYCEQEKLETVDLSDNPDDSVTEMSSLECHSCGLYADESVHIEDDPEYDHGFEEVGASPPVMKDTTVHLETCPALDTEPYAWKEVEAIVVLTPRMYEPLNVEQEPEPEDPDEDDAFIAGVQEAAAEVEQGEQGTPWQEVKDELELDEDDDSVDVETYEAGTLPEPEPEPDDPEPEAETETP